ncbi:MAG TPA: four helix bundle protein, partial [Gemmataceae bacterium]|nr:four helix bundle protein [Gemmataceae bacterium]
NIAEGSSRSSDADFARFVEIAYGSLMETVSQAVIARKQNSLPDDRFQEVYKDAEEIGRMLSGLRAKLLPWERPGKAVGSVLSALRSRLSCESC